MTCFLTSSSCVRRTPALNPENGFVEELRGEAYLIRDGVLRQIGGVGDRLPLP